MNQETNFEKILKMALNARIEEEAKSILSMDTDVKVPPEVDLKVKKLLDNSLKRS